MCCMFKVIKIIFENDPEHKFIMASEKHQILF